MMSDKEFIKRLKEIDDFNRKFIKENKMTRYDYASRIDEMLSKASLDLPSESFDGLLDDISMMLADYESEDET